MIQVLLTVSFNCPSYTALLKRNHFLTANYSCLRNWLINMGLKWKLKIRLGWKFAIRQRFEKWESFLKWWCTKCCDTCGILRAKKEIFKFTSEINVVLKMRLVCTHMAIELICFPCMKIRNLLRKIIFFTLCYVL